MVSFSTVLMLLLLVDADADANAGAPSGQAPATRALQGAQISGRATLGGDTYLLDTTPDRARTWRMDAQGRVGEPVAVIAPSMRIEAFGLAESADGLLWALADKGKTLVGFHPENGTVTDVRTLPTHCTGVWSVDGVVMVAALRLSGGEPFLYEMTSDGFRPCGSLRTRAVKSPLDAAILSMFACGGSRSSVLPCWWIAGEPAVLLLRGSCASKNVPVASMTTPRGSVSPKSSDPIDRFDYPIRDVYRVDDRYLWLLTNQEGPQLSDGTAARHALLVVDGRIERTVPLRRKGRFVLSGDREHLTVLYTDGTIETVGQP